MSGRTVLWYISHQRSLRGKLLENLSLKLVSIQGIGQQDLKLGMSTLLGVSSAMLKKLCNGGKFCAGSKTYHD